MLAITDNEAAPVGALQFSSATYTVAENGGSATITITRTGGSAGAVGVSFATSNGTATAGSDYTATTQSISFADGDTANKTVSIPILDDAVFEGNETINLALSNPTGGATLGSPSTAVLTITDNEATLTISKTGAGSGLVTSSPAGIDCGVNCVTTYSTGTVVTLTAIAAAGSSFAGWTGSNCRGTGLCTITINANVNVNARFAKQ